MKVKKRNLLYVVLALAAFALGFVVTLKSATPERFDRKVQQDFFAGFTGDKEAFERAMKNCEQALAADPKNAEAMVWHGVGVFYSSGQLFRDGDRTGGMELYSKALAEMKHAVEIEPDNVAVRSARGLILLQSTLYMEGNPEKDQLLKLVLEDFEHIYQLQEPAIGKLGAHSRGELLFGIADAHYRLGNQAKAKEWFERISRDMPDTGYQKRAAEWLKTGSLPMEQERCASCHTEN